MNDTGGGGYVKEKLHSPFAVFATTKASKISSNFLPEFLFTKHLFLDIKQTSSLNCHFGRRDEVWHFLEKIRISTFSTRNRRKQKKKP